MNQIPKEGEFCGECPCFSGIMCNLYKQWVYADLTQITVNYTRLPICLKERPQIITTGKEEEDGNKKT